MIERTRSAACHVSSTCHSLPLSPTLARDLSFSSSRSRHPKQYSPTGTMFDMPAFVSRPSIAAMRSLVLLIVPESNGFARHVCSGRGASFRRWYFGHVGRTGAPATSEVDQVRCVSSAVLVLGSYARVSASCVDGGKLGLCVYILLDTIVCCFVSVHESDARTDRLRGNASEVRQLSRRSMSGRDARVRVLREVPIDSVPGLRRRRSSKSSTARSKSGCGGDARSWKAFGDDENRTDASASFERRKFSFIFEHSVT